MQDRDRSGAIKANLYILNSAPISNDFLLFRVLGGKNFDAISGTDS